MIDKPGVYDLPVNDYHADPVKGGSLSSTGARKLLPPSCPAKYRQWVDDPVDETSTAFDFGHAAHRLVLGAGMDYEIVDPADYLTAKGEPGRGWNTAGAKERVAELRAAGITPLHLEDAGTVELMASELRTHPLVGNLFTPTLGAPEQTLIWQDEDTGVWCRALLDWLPTRDAGKRLIVTDYKTARSAEPGTFGRAAASYGYHVQAAFYLAGVRALGLDTADNPAAFLFVVQEKEPPYLVTLVELDADALDLGDRLVRRALNTYAACTSSGTWPAYAEHVVQVSLPNWVDYAYGEDMA